MAALARNIDNVRAAWEWTAAGGSLSDLSAAMEPLELFFRFSGAPAQGIDLLAATATGLQAQIKTNHRPAGETLPVLYELWRHEALLLELCGRGETALDRLEGARAGWEARGDHHNLSRVLSEMAYVHMRRTNHMEAIPLAESALALASALEDNTLMAGTLHNLGNALAYSGDLPGGRALLHESIAHYRAAGDRRWLAGAMSDVSMTYNYEGEIDSARAFILRSLALAEAAGDLPGIALATSNLGGVALDSGDLDESDEQSRRAQGVAQEIGDMLMLSVSVGNQGHVALARGDRAAALRFYLDAALLCRDSGYIYMLVEIVAGLARLAVEESPSLAARWLASVAAWRSAAGFEIMTSFVRALHDDLEARLRVTPYGMPLDAAKAAEPVPPLERATAEAMAWAMEQKLVM